MNEPTGTNPEQERFRKRALLLLVVGVTLLFLAVIRPFIVSVLLAAIFAGMFHGVYRWFVERVKGRTRTASALTVLLVFLLIVLPATGFFTLVASQAVGVADSARPWIEEQINQPGGVEAFLDRIPLLDRLGFLGSLLPDRDQVIEKLGEAASFMGSFLVSSLATVTKGTLNVVLQLFIVLYAMFFFLLDGRRTLDRILYFIPLSPDDEEQLVERFVSVTRATLKGSLVIGILQGALAGVAFWIAGIQGAAFWGTVMVVLSVIPGVGAALVWVPAVLYLLATGAVGTGVALGIWCAVVVGTIDNFLRPRLVGRDTKMSDLMILLSTLGGIVLFGAIGFILGPIVAAVFVTVWDLYGQTFSEILPPSPLRES
ncbi:MAG: AI-2E family transporter [Gemmatimonadota bacterium]